MSSQTALTGRLGKAVVEDTMIARMTKFGVSDSLASKSEWGDSDSEGYTNRAAGREDGTNDAEGKFDLEDEVWDIFAPKDIIEEVLWMNASLYWAFPRALCIDFKLEVNIDSQEVIGWNASFGADGIFYRPGQAGAPTHTLPT